MVREKGEREIVEEVEKDETLSYALHSDTRETLVEIEGDLFKLVPTGKTLREIKGEKDFKKIPHIRRLNPIPRRDEKKQDKHNQETEEIHNLSKGSIKSGKITSVRKAAELGANVPEEVKRLMEEKEKAQKAGDEKKARQIRRQLRSLDYKRYLK